MEPTETANQYDWQAVQAAHKRPLECNDQTPPNEAKRPRMDIENYQTNQKSQQLQQPQPTMPQWQHQQAQQWQLPQTPLPHLPQSSFTHSPMSPFPSFYPLAAMQQPLTSTPMGGREPFMGSFQAYFPTPPSGDAVSSFFVPSGAPPLTPLSSRTTTEIDENHVFKEVTSNLSLEIGCKVKVTVGELRRRTGAPEYLDVNQLARLTKHPKSTFSQFQRNFAKHGFKIAANNGKSRGYGMLTFITEGDALILAKDFTKIVSTELSTPILASVVASAAHKSIHSLVLQAESIREHLSCARNYLLSTGRKPSELATLEKEGAPIEQAMKDFSLATHGFGPLAAVAVIDSLISLVGYTERNFAPVDLATSFNDSGLGCSIHEITPCFPKHAASESKNSIRDADLDLLQTPENDHIVYGETIPRIAFDNEPIKVTIGELRRRAFGPEKFTVSLMNNYMRKGKKSNTHNDMRNALGELGITMQSTKGLVPNSWSSLSETEATAMSAQTAHFLSSLPPSAAMKQRAATAPQSAAWIRFLACHLQCAMTRIGLLPGQSTIETETDRHVLRFALISHHFGHSFYASVMNWLQIVA